MVEGIRLKIGHKIVLTQAIPVSLLVITAVVLYVAISTMTPAVISLEIEIAKLRKNSELREQVNSLESIRHELQQNAIQYAKAPHPIIKTRYEFSLRAPLKIHFSRSKSVITQ